MNFSDSAVQSYDGKIMKYGDLVLLYEGHGNLSYIYLQKGVILNNKFGAFHHHTFVDKPYGSKILSHNKHSFIYALQCTPELWTYALHTRTQIVDSVDSSIVTTALDLFPGCVVAESGTGSGCMTMALARCVSPNGRVFSYEYNSTRAQTASDEFKKLRVDNLITVQCHDLCEPEAGPDTGGFLGVSPQSLDAIFLDLPEPWRALKYVPSVLKPNRSICCYSPCVEQVMKTCDKLRELGFHSIKMFEVRQKPHTAFNISMETADIGQPDSAGTCGVAREEEEPTSKKTKREDGSSSGADSSLTTCGGGTGGKHYRPRTLPGVPVKVARPDATMKGHTAYLTFATAPTAFPKK